MRLPNNDGCLKYWDLAKSVRIDAAVALWCGVEPGELKKLGFQTSCMDAKRAAIEDALLDKRLDYIDEGVQFPNGKVWEGCSVSELIQKDRLRIPKASLRRWFLDMPISDRPSFLFEEERRQPLLPDGSSVTEMNTTKALAIMAWMLAEAKPVYKISERPNSSAIGKTVEELARKVFGEDERGFASFNKRISAALNILDEYPKEYPF